MDRIQPPFTDVAPTAFSQALENASEGDEIRMIVSGPDFDTGKVKETTLVLPITGDVASRMDATGLMLMTEGDVVKMDEPSFSSPFASSLGSFDFYGDEPVQIASVKAPADQMAKEWVFIPALILLVLVAMLQRARMGRKGEIS